MIVHLKRAVSDSRARYIVYDEKGQQRYNINGSYFSTFEKLNIRSDDHVVLVIREINAPLGVLRAYRITKGSESFNLIITQTRNMLSVNFFGISFSVQGDLYNKCYSIIDIDGTVQAYVKKDHIKGYTDIDIRNEQRELFCIAIAVCISSIALNREYKAMKA